MLISRGVVIVMNSDATFFQINTRVKETLHVRYRPYCPEHSKALLRDPTKVISEDWWAGTKSSIPSIPHALGRISTNIFQQHDLSKNQTKQRNKQTNQRNKETNKQIKENKQINKQNKETKQRNKTKKQTTSILLAIHPAPHPSPKNTSSLPSPPRGIWPSTRSSVPSENRSITGANKPKVLNYPKQTGRNARKETGHENKIKIRKLE